MSITLKDKKRVGDSRTPITVIRHSEEEAFYLDYAGCLWMHLEEGRQGHRTIRLSEGKQTPSTSFDVARSQKNGPSIIAVGNEKGEISIIQASGSSVKEIKDAHTGSVIQLRFSPDGQTLASSSDDCLVKLWSKTGILRTKLPLLDDPAYALIWSPDCNQILYGSEKNLHFKSLKPSNSDIVVRSTSVGVVLSIDWSLIENLVVASGEDCTFRIIDSSGQVLFVSGKMYKTPIFAVQWSAFGSMFAGCSLNNLFLANTKGNMIAQITLTIPATSMNINSTSAQLVVGLQDGQAQSAAFISVTSIQYKQFAVLFTSSHEIKVEDTSCDYSEVLDFPDNAVTLVELAFDHLLVVTKGKVSIHNLQSLQTPSIFNLPQESLLFAGLAKNFCYFVTIAGHSQCHVFDYNGKSLDSFRLDCQQPIVSKKLFDCQKEHVCLVDLFNPRQVLLLTKSGKIQESIQHSNDIYQLSLSRVGQSKIAFLDSNNDLIIYFTNTKEMKKIASLVRSFAWNETLDALAFISGDKLTVVYSPNALQLDQQLLEYSSITEITSTGLKLTEFNECAITSIGEKQQLISHTLDPLVLKMLFLLAEDNSTNDLSNAMSLARFLKHTPTWAVLAVHALQAEDTVNYETCLGQLGLVDKVKLMSDINALDNKNEAHCQTLLLLGKTAEVERLLLSKKQFFECARIYCRLFAFGKALDVARQADSSNEWIVDYVIMKRSRYVQTVGSEMADARQFKGLTANRSDTEIRQLRKAYLMA